MRAAVYTFVHRHNVCDTADPELTDRPLFCNRKINTAKGANFYARLCSVSKWLLEQEVWIKIDEHIWSIPSLVTKETRLRVL